MRKLFIVVALLIPFLSPNYSNILRAYQINQEQKQQKIQDYQLLLTKQIIINKYPWMNSIIYDVITKQLKPYKLDHKQTLYFVKLVSAIIDKESKGRSRAIGPKCKVILIKNGRYVKEIHRARGLMQVMAFHTPYPRSKYHKLYNINTNIKYGIRVLMLSYRNANNIVDTLKNYNSGINSKFYNWAYINSIVKDINAMDIYI